MIDILTHRISASEGASGSVSSPTVGLQPPPVALTASFDSTVVNDPERKGV